MSLIPNDDPAVIAEVRAQFDRYETALVTNDVAVLDDLFQNAPQTVRYGVAETLYGFDEIAAFRAGRDASRLNRSLTRVHIAAYGARTWQSPSASTGAWRRAGAACRARPGCARPTAGAWRRLTSRCSPSRKGRHVLSRSG